MKKLLAHRVYWNRGIPGAGWPKNYSTKMSIKLLWEPRDIWVGIYWSSSINQFGHLFVYICLLPCLPIRIHYERSYGGRFK